MYVRSGRPGSEGVPRASREEVIERGKGEPLVVKVREPAESGKANKALLKVLARHFNAAEVRIVACAKSKRKIVEIVGK